MKAGDIEVPGFYWYRENGNLKIVDVTHDKHAQRKVAWFFGMADEYPLSTMPGEFFGPIEEPKID